MPPSKPAAPARASLCRRPPIFPLDAARRTGLETAHEILPRAALRPSRLHGRGGRWSLDLVFERYGGVFTKIPCPSGDIGGSAESGARPSQRRHGRQASGGNSGPRAREALDEAREQRAQSGAPLFEKREVAHRLRGGFEIRFFGAFNFRKHGARIFHRGFHET